MNWISDLANETIYNYRSIVGEVISGTAEELSEIADRKVTGEPGNTFMFADHVYTYAGFQPKKLGIMTKTVFEKNGRKGMKILHSDGSSATRSMTRENLFKGKGVQITGDKRDAKGEKTGEKAYEVQSSLSRGCQDASDKAKGEILRGRLTHMKQEITMANQMAKASKKGKR